MSAVPCHYCGQLRKVEQVFSSDGWHNPPCSHCGAPGWTQRDGEEPFGESQPPPAGAGEEQP